LGLILEPTNLVQLNLWRSANPSGLNEFPVTEKDRLFMYKKLASQPADRAARLADHDMTL
jgi:hypothetical protein